MYDAIYPINVYEKKYPFYLTGIGINQKEYNVVRTSGLTSHQFLLTLEGEGRLTIGEKEFILRANTLFFITPGIPHSYRPNGDSWKTAWIVFRGEALPAIITNMEFKPYEFIELKSSNSFMQIFHRIYSLAKDSIFGGIECSKLLYELVLETDEWKKSSGYTLDIVKRTVEYFEDNYQSDISLSVMAGLSNVSTQHLCRVFKQKMGLSPLEYLTTRRIAVAKRLLIETDKSISEIAALSGYSGLTYFGMVFKKQEGISAGDFRKTHGMINL